MPETPPHQQQRRADAGPHPAERTVSASASAHLTRGPVEGELARRLSVRVRQRTSARAGVGRARRPQP